MDIQAIIDQVMDTVGNAPEKISEILSDPQGAIEGITGQQLGEGDLSQIVSGVKDRIAEGGIDLSQIDLSQIDLGAITDQLGGLGDLVNNSPIGDIAGGLFGKKN